MPSTAKYSSIKRNVQYKRECTQVAEQAERLYGDRIEKVLNGDAPVWYGSKKVDWYD